MTALPDIVGVIGGGRMGAGIAQVFAAAGSTVTIVEANQHAATAARDRVAAGLARAAEKSSLRNDPREHLDRVSAVTSLEELPVNARLVIEAVPESISQKIAVLAAVEKVVAANAVLASNTSSLSIAELATALDFPHRLLGMHFFNPVPASALIEIVRGPHTGAGVLKVVLDWTHKLGKCSVVVRDSPGFATSRLGVALGLEAIRMLEEAVADAESIDRAMELGYRHPMGPLRSTDLVGLDVRLAIAEHLHTALGERFRPPQLLRDKVSRGELGRKTGHGFFQWPK